MDHNDKKEDMTQYSKDGKQTYCPTVNIANIDENDTEKLFHHHWIFDVARKLG